MFSSPYKELDQIYEFSESMKYLNQISIAHLKSRAINKKLTEIRFLLTTGYQAIFCDIGYQGEGWLPPPRFRVRFKILYRVIQRLIQHCFLSKMVYLIVNYVVATRNYDFCNTRTGP